MDRPADRQWIWSLMCLLSKDNMGEVDFPAEQAAILRDLARNGAADEASVYGYADVGSNGQSNGTAI